MRRSRFRPPVDLGRSAFSGFRFPPEVIVLAVRWYLRYGLTYRDLEELLAERGVEVDHVTLFRWVQRFTPLLTEAARPCAQHMNAGLTQLHAQPVRIAIERVLRCRVKSKPGERHFAGNGADVDHRASRWNCRQQAARQLDRRKKIQAHQIAD